MDPADSNGGENSQGNFPSGNSGAYQHTTWPPYMYGYQQPSGYGYQLPPGFVPQGFQPRPPNVAMMNTSAYPPEGFRQGVGFQQPGFQQPQTSETFVQHADADVAGGSAPTSKKRNKTGVTRTKLGNFNPDEDKNLVKAWLEISCDPITNTGQKKDRMWERIIKQYNSRRGRNPERSEKSLQSRWDFIRAEVTVFAEFYAHTIRENPSGMSDADKTTHAAGNYAAALKKKFTFMHCWELMKDEPKWQAPNVRETTAAARGEGFGEDTTAPTETVDLREGQSSPVRSGAHARRPMGRDSAKAAKKKVNSDAASTSSAELAAKMFETALHRNSLMEDAAVRRNERFEEMRKNHEALLQIEREKLQLAHEQLEDARRKEEKEEDERILKIDLEACRPDLREYYQICKEEIMEKKRRGRRQGP